MSFTSAGTVRAGWRDVYLAVGARALSIAGDFLVATALVLQLQERGYGGIAVAAVLLAAALPPVVLSPLTGPLVDRVDSRTLLVTVGVIQALCCLAMAYVSGPVVLIALSALLAAGLAVTTPTFAALLPDMVDRERLPRAVALGQTATAIGALIGPALAGVLVGQFGLRVPLLVDAATYLAIAGVGFALRTRRNAKGADLAAPASADHGEPSAPAPVWRMRDDRLIFAIVVQIAALVAVLNVTQVLEVFFVRDTLGASPTAYGLIVASFTTAMLVGGWLFALRTPDDAGLGRRLVWCAATMSLAVALVGQAPSVGWVVALWVVGGICNGGMNAALGVLASRRVPAANRGRMFARLGAVVNTANMLGYAVGGVLADRFDPGLMISVCGLLGVVAVAVTAARVLRAGSPPAGAATPERVAVG